MCATNTIARKGIKLIEGYLHEDDPKGYDQPATVAHNQSRRSVWCVCNGTLSSYIKKVADISDLNDICDVVDFIDHDPLDPVVAGLTDAYDITTIDRFRTASEQGDPLYIVHYVDSHCCETDTMLYYDRPAMYDSVREAVDDYLGGVARANGIQFRDIDGLRVFYGFPGKIGVSDFIYYYGGGISVVADIDGKFICDYPTEQDERAAQDNGVWLSLTHDWPAFNADNSHGVGWEIITKDNITGNEMSERFAGNKKLLRAYDGMTDYQALLIDLDTPGCFEVISRRTSKISAPEGTYYIGVVM